MTKPVSDDLLPSDEPGLTAALLEAGFTREKIDEVLRKKRDLELLPYWARCSNRRGPRIKFTIINWLHRPVFKLEYLWARYVKGDLQARDLIGVWPSEEPGRPGRWDIFDNRPRNRTL